MPLRDWVPAIGLRRYSSMYVCLCCMLTTCSTCCSFTYSYCPLVNLTELFLYLLILSIGESDGAVPLPTLIVHW